MCAAVERLIIKLEPTGAYASMIVKDISSSEVHLAFELEGDARRFGAAVNAEVSEGYPGWATQQSFLLSDVRETALAPSHTPPVIMRPPRNKLKHDIELLGQAINANTLTLKSKTLNEEPRTSAATDGYPRGPPEAAAAAVEASSGQLTVNSVAI